jgi:iron complex transport system substrate-binding protein
MFFKKNFVMLLWCAVLTILATNGAAASEKCLETELAKAPQEISASGKVSLKDQVGREVTFNVNPKVASCYYISTLISLVLGGADNLVGIENQSAHQPIYASFGDRVPGLPQIGSGKGVNYEELAKSGADVVIIPKRLQESIPQIEQINVQPIVVVPETLDGLLECFEILGKVYGEQEKAAGVVSYYQSKIEEISALTAAKGDGAPKVYVAGSSGFLSAAGGKMYQSAIVELAGGVNVVKGFSSGNWDQISLEQLQVYAPDIILIANGANYTPEDLYKNVQLKNIPAVDNKRVYAFPSKQDAWDIPSASSILGIMWAANKINPSLYTDDKLAQETEVFYKRFYKTDIRYSDVVGK